MLNLYDISQLVKFEIFFMRLYEKKKKNKTKMFLNW